MSQFNKTPLSSTPASTQASSEVRMSEGAGNKRQRLEMEESSMEENVEMISDSDGINTQDSNDTRNLKQFQKRAKGVAVYKHFRKAEFYMVDGKRVQKDGKLVYKFVCKQHPSKFVTHHALDKSTPCTQGIPLYSDGIPSEYGY